MTEQVDRIGQWFVDATDPTKWYGPVTKCVDGTHYCERGWNGQAWILADSGDYLRIPPKLDLPPGKRTRECRLPKKGERYVDLDGKVRSASMPYSAGLIGDSSWRRWIVEDEPEARGHEGRDKVMKTNCEYCGDETESASLTRLMAKQDDGSWETLWEAEVCPACRKAIAEKLDRGK